MRKSNIELWGIARSAGMLFFCEYSTRQQRQLEAFAAAVRADEAEHTRQACEERAIKWNRHELSGMSLSEAILNAGKAPALKPCPFCGGEALLRDNLSELWWFVCKQCDMETSGETTEAAAIAAWNRRA